VSPLRLVVLLSAAVAALAAAGRLWLSALTPGAAPLIIRVEPDRSLWDRAAAIRVAPKLSQLLAPPPQAAAVRHKGRPVARNHVRAASAVRVSYQPASAPIVQYANRTIPPPRPQRPVSHSPKPTPRTHAPTPAPASKPTPAPVPTPTPAPATVPISQPVAATAPASEPQPATVTTASPPETTTAPPPAPVGAPAPEPVASTPPPVTTPVVDPPLETRPGHGYGDPNHVHTGPPGQS